ncbi:uncharacterized protein J4E84_002153 [Alternaria hordeiaustralica]|uniref:uncharacterized protein n=1 Tax=Alternaria hordeiaustralica TaxID=1187925 RepID=UPI0020C536CB|nr:uncharacterized protein J4E84_002153 [Alternaria hordeiaustralica]KAI4695526.1 hypothetical protein J4E84_002153 [Alternaria hordeiaustralica]
MDAAMFPQLAFMVFLALMVILIIIYSITSFYIPAINDLIISVFKHMRLAQRQEANVIEKALRNARQANTGQEGFYSLGMTGEIVAPLNIGSGGAHIKNMYAPIWASNSRSVPMQFGGVPAAEQAQK